MDKKTHVDSDEVICKDGPVDIKAQVARDRVLYNMWRATRDRQVDKKAQMVRDRFLCNVRRSLTISGADVVEVHDW